MPCPSEKGEKEILGNDKPVNLTLVSGNNTKQIFLKVTLKHGQKHSWEELAKPNHV